MSEETPFFGELPPIGTVPTRQSMISTALDFGSRSFVPEEGEGRVDPLKRLFDPQFTDVTWECESSKVGDLPGKLHPKQLMEINNPTRHRWLFWGNQTGKTTVGAVDVALSVLGRHPLQLAGLERKPPYTAWASALTWELWEKILLPELLSWIPPWRVLDAPPAFRMSTKRDIIVLADNGTESRITGKAAQQGAGSYQSARVNLIWLDEEHPESVWDEMQARLLRFSGRTIATMTPLLGMTWVHGRVYEPIQTGQIDGTRHTFSHAGLRDNPSITAEARAEMLLELRHNPAQLAARDEGLFVRPHGAVLPWDAKLHLTDVTPERMTVLRVKGAWYGALDLGKWRFAFHFGVADTEKNFLIVDEYFSQNEDVDVRAKAMHALLKSWKVPDSISIPADCADPKGIKELNEALERLHSPYHVYPIDGKLKKVTAGIARVESLLNRGALKVRRGMGAAMTWYLGRDASKFGKPVMGSRWMWEIANWLYPRTAEGKVQKDEPDDASADGADMMDTLRYLAMSFFGADAPQARPRNSTLAERLQKELEDLDKQEELFKPSDAERFGGMLRQ
jgi:phage terminase large subunit-like protein